MADGEFYKAFMLADEMADLLAQGQPITPNEAYAQFGKAQIPQEIAGPVVGKLFSFSNPKDAVAYFSAEERQAKEEFKKIMQAGPVAPIQPNPSDY